MRISVGFDGWLLLFGILMSENKQVGIVCIVCAIFHELGHLCAAGAMGIKIRELRLGFAGAKIYPEDEMISYKKEFFLCAWGPIFNIIFALIAITVLFFIYRSSPPSAESITVEIFSVLNGGGWHFDTLLLLSVIVSLMQATVNLLPIESLDGSRMMVSLLAKMGSASLANKAEKATTLFSAFCLWLCSVYLLLKTGSGIGIFVFAGCIFARLIKPKIFEKNSSAL